MKFMRHNQIKFNRFESMAAGKVNQAFEEDNDTIDNKDINKPQKTIPTITKVMSVAPDCPLPLIYTDLVFSNIHSSDSATLPETLSNSLSWGG